jgi:hypothetical protein
MPENDDLTLLASLAFALLGALDCYYRAAGH